MPHKKSTAPNSDSEWTVQIKLPKLDSIDCVTLNDSPSSDTTSSSSMLLKRPFTSKHMMAHLQTKCPLSYPTSGSCDHNGGVLTSKYGDLKLTIPKGAIKNGDMVIFCIETGLYGPFALPSNFQADLASPYYWIGVSRLYSFQKPIQVEFEHFGACDPSHYQLLCCEDDDESYTMRPVDYELSFSARDKISRCTFETYHCCSYCLHHNCKDPVMNRIAAIYLKAKDFQSSKQFATEVWFSFHITICLKRNEELYTQEGMVFDKKFIYIFEASCDINSTSYFTLAYHLHVNGWDVKHVRSMKIETKEINFYNYYTDEKELKAMEENGSFPQRFILIATKKSECNTDLNTEMTITLHKNEEKIPCNFLISTIMKMTPNTPEDKAVLLTGILIIRIKQ